MKISRYVICLTLVAIVSVLCMSTRRAEAWQTSYTGLTWISADSSYFRRVNLDTVTSWHNYDIKFNATPAASNGDGSRMFNFTTTMATDPASSGAEWSNIYGSATYTAGTNGVFTLNGVEGVARPNASALGGTFRGGYFRTYASGVNYKVTSMIGSDFSVRSIANWNPKYGTACVGARIYMAVYPATAAMGQDSINNYHGLWIYDENTTGLATTNAIKIGTGGARFKYDLVGQSGGAIVDSTGGFQFKAPINVDTMKTGNNKDMWFIHTPLTTDADYTRTFQFRNTYSNAIGAGVNHSTLYSRATWQSTGDSYGFINAVEGQFRAHAADEAMTGTGLYGFSYIDNATYPTATCRTLYAGRFGLRTEADYAAENGTGFFGLDVNMDGQVAAANQGNMTNWTGMRIWSASVASGLIANRGIQLYVPGTQHIQKDIEFQDGHTLEDSGGVFKFDAPLTAPGCSLGAGGVSKADTGKFKVVAMAKDTSVEIASFGRTAIADTAAYITGVDSLTCAYLITPFATRNVITAVPTVSGIAATSNLLIIRRPAADTAAYDRYSIVRIPQR